MTNVQRGRNRNLRHASMPSCDGNVDETVVLKQRLKICWKHPCANLFFDTSFELWQLGSWYLTLRSGETGVELSSSPQMSAQQEIQQTGEVQQSGEAAEEASEAFSFF